MFISQNQAHNFFSQPLIQHAVAVIGVEVMLFYAKSTVVKRRGKCCVSRIESTFHLMFFFFLFGMIAGQENRVMDLHGEVMACAYEDVQVMWSILDKSKSSTCNITS